MPNEPSSVLLNTNILVRFTTPNDPLHVSTVDKLAKLVSNSVTLFFSDEINRIFQIVKPLSGSIWELRDRFFSVHSLSPSVPLSGL